MIEDNDDEVQYVPPQSHRRKRIRTQLMSQPHTSDRRSPYSSKHVAIDLEEDSIKQETGRSPIKKSNPNVPCNISFTEVLQHRFKNLQEQINILQTRVA